MSPSRTPRTTPPHRVLEVAKPFLGAANTRARGIDTHEGLLTGLVMPATSWSSAQKPAAMTPLSPLPSTRLRHRPTNVDLCPPRRLSNVVVYPEHLMEQ